MNNELIKAMAELNRVKIFKIVREEIKKDTDPLKIIDWLSQGLQIVGDFFERKEYFLAELVTGGDIFNSIFQEIKPILDKKNIDTQVKGKIVIGTVQGDIHDIGKNIVITILRASGFDVEDLGVDVPSKKFLEAIKQPKVKILGLSALLTVAVDSVKEVIKLLEEQNLRSKIKIIVGGSAFNENVAKNLGVDAYGKDPMEAVKKCEEFLEI